MQPIMLTMFMALMSLTSWTLFQQVNLRAQGQAVDAVAHTVRELARTQRLWHTQHGEGVPWQNRYLTHVPDICPHLTCNAGQWLQLTVPLWYCEGAVGLNAGDRLPVFSFTTAPACPGTLNIRGAIRGITGRITDRHGNPRVAGAPSATVAQAKLAGAAAPWWDDKHPDADAYATWATRTGPDPVRDPTGPARLAGDHSFQVIYRAGPDSASAPAREWQEARAQAQRVANALGALACVGRRKHSSSTTPTAAQTWYDCDEGAELGRRRGPGSGSGDLALYYVIARYERPLARTMVDSMLPRDGKLHAWGDFRFSTPKVTRSLKTDGSVRIEDEEIRLRHDTGGLAMRHGARLIVGCDGDPARCEDERSLDLDARSLPFSTQIRRWPLLPALYLRTLKSPGENDVPIALVASPSGPEATFGRVRMRVNGSATGAVEGVEDLRPPTTALAGAGVQLKMAGTGEKRMVVCSNEHVSRCAAYHP